MRKTILACVAVALIVGSTSATAATLITGKQIKNGSITRQDIKKGSINAARLSDGLQNKIDGRGVSGPAGPAGAKGDPGPAGPKGDNGKDGKHGVANVIYDADAAAATTAGVQPDFGDRKGGTLIRDLTLKPGSYEIEAAMSVRGPTDGTAGDSPIARVRCNLVNATTSDPAKDRLDTFFQDFFRPDNDSPGFREGLHIGALVTFSEETKVEVRCYTYLPGDATGPGVIASSKIVATEVAKITPGS